MTSSEGGRNPLALTITIVETMTSSEGGRNPLALTITIVETMTSSEAGRNPLALTITIVETMASSEGGRNPLALTIINYGKEYWLSQGSNQQPPVLKSGMLSTELCRLGAFKF